VDWLGFVGGVDLKAHVKHCGSVSPDMRDYFRRDLDRTTQNKKARQRESLLREEVATERNVIHNIEWTMMRNCNVQYTFLQRRRNMLDEYNNKVASMSKGVGRLNNNQVVVCLTN
jgi:hypothetical protein